MHSTQTQHSNENEFVADIKKIGHNVTCILKKGLKAAAVAKICPNDKQAISRILSED